MSRATLWISAGACLSVAVVLTLLGVGDQAGRAAELAGARAGARPGRDGAAADLLVGSPDPRAVARRLAVPEGARRLQPDVRRGAPPGHARRGRRLLLARHRRARGRVVPDARRTRRIETAEERIAWFVFVATIPAPRSACSARTRSRRHLGEPWQIAIALAVFGAPALVSPTGSRSGGRWAISACKAAVGMGFAQSLALMPGVSRSGITISAGPLAPARPGLGRALLVSAARADRARRGRAEGREGRPARRPAAGLEGAVRRRHARRGRERADRDLRAPRLRAPPRLLDLRLVPA